MMTAAHIARLRQDVQTYVDQEQGRTGKPVALSSIEQHIISIGWNLADSSMFSDWVSNNIAGSIDYKN